MLPFTICLDWLNWCHLFGILSFWFGEMDTCPIRCPMAVFPGCISINFTFLLLSLSKNSSALEMVSAVFSYPATLLPDSFKALHTQLQVKEHTMEMQTEDRHLACDHCNLSFEMTKDLRTHMLQHDGKKSHSCNQCGYSSIRADHLKIHVERSL